MDGGACQAVIGTSLTCYAPIAYAHSIVLRVSAGSLVSPVYAAPELRRSDLPADSSQDPMSWACDWWGLGYLLYQLLVG